MNQTQIRYLLAAGWGVYAGVVAGYLLTKKKYERIANEEIESVKATYADRLSAMVRNIEHKPKIEIEVDPPGSPHDLREQVVKISNEQGYETPESDEEDDYAPEEEMVKTTVEEITEAFNEEKFPSPVDPDNPYVITEEEFHDAEVGYQRMELTYYSGDDVLVGPGNQVIRAIDKVVGDESLTKFDQYGYVYVRNIKQETDYQIEQMDTSYSEAVLKARKPKPVKSRFGDDDE